MLAFDGVGKRYPGVIALDGVSFAVAGGSIHALLGENGAGKSTLLKILAGAVRPDQGCLRIAGAQCNFHSTGDALAAGVAVIQQELQLCPDLSVAENILLGRLPRRFGAIDWAATRRRAAAVLAELDEPIDPAARLGDLPIGARQMVEIAKALAREARILALDEPTSSLSVREVNRLFAVCRRLRDQGRALIYVSHRMDEIESLCDAATVLRDGRHVVSHATLNGIGRDELVRAMCGRELGELFPWSPRPLGEPLLSVAGVAGPGLHPAAPASFTVRAGEIVGLFGLIGAGRSELMRLLAGAVPRQGGSVRVAHQELPNGSPARAIAAGLVLAPEDRKRDGCVLIHSVQDNINLHVRQRFSRPGWLIRPVRERANAAAHITALGVKTPSAAKPVGQLSGGNQQKCILGRALGEQPRVLLLDEPTRGIDVGAKREIYRIIAAQAAAGLAVVLVSSELPEVLGVCDRVLVMRQGRLVADLPRGSAEAAAVLALALPVGDEAGPASPTDHPAETP